MLRRVLVEHHQLGALMQIIEERTTTGRRVRLGIALDRDHIGVSRTHPKPRRVLLGGVPVHGLVAAQLVEEIVRRSRVIGVRVIQVHRVCHHGGGLRVWGMRMD